MSDETTIPHREGLALGPLDLSAAAVAAFARALAAPGLLLFCAPAGAGKTTVIASLLRSRLNDGHFVLAARPGTEIAGVLQDAVVEVGDIQSLDTASLALPLSDKALVVGAIRIGSTRGSACVRRLLDMGVDDAIIRRRRLTVVAQRQCRRLCTSCRKPARIDLGELGKLGVEEQRLPIFGGWVYEASGCDECRGTGYLGFVPIFGVEFQNAEATLADESVGADRFSIEAALTDDAVLKLLSGATSLEQLVLVVPPIASPLRG
jgi:type II secretory ATPase GspE/PulE/Tfp pilus assembly ATPase PilB-like protein